MKEFLYKEESVFLISNLVKSLFFSYWILWRVCFSHIEFCQESVFLILNFVKSPFFSYWILWIVCFSNVEFYEMSENGLNFPPGKTPALCRSDHNSLLTTLKKPNVKICSRKSKWSLRNFTQFFSNNQSYFIKLYV